MGFLGIAYGSVLRGDLENALVHYRHASSPNNGTLHFDVVVDDATGLQLEKGVQLERRLAELKWETAWRLATPPLILVASGKKNRKGKQGFSFTNWIVSSVSGVLSAKLGLLLEGNALLFLAMLSFASASLVFLVTQELLIEVDNKQA